MSADLAGGILTGPEICRQVADGRIVIDPWAPEQVHDDRDEYAGKPQRWSTHRRVNSASYDLRLGSKVAVYTNVVGVADFGTIIKRLHGEKTLSSIGVSHGRRLVLTPDGVLDSKKKLETVEIEMDPAAGFLCKPGIGYLMHNAERIHTKEFVPVLDGKSSVGRLFTTVHVTAGYGDAGFNGQFTLEVTVTHPTIVYPGMFFAQIRFHTQVGERLDYAKKGHYVGAASMGPVASMAHKQFEEDASDG